MAYRRLIVPPDRRMLLMGDAGKPRYFAQSFLDMAMTYSETVSERSYAMSWFVPPIVVPALLAALLLAWIAYQAYS